MRCSLMFSILVASFGLLLTTDVLQSADELDTLESLRQKKVKAAEEWRESFVLNRAGPSETTTMHDGVFEASLALKDAQLELASSQADRVRTLTTHRESMELLLRKIEALREAAARGGEPHARAKARFYVLQAEIWVKEAEMKP